ncbi:alpha/beta fold hydrolase [Chitinophaga vietnamensis]|uniref:alpha/beta fold hydrolase n=1 Tax=Chitinophaga vietnamensis TaxID=2593957 RepID=UPI001178AEFF|nr:alpha/beta fold hydrolase [Chitinophaga vietnamensis]
MWKFFGVLLGCVCLGTAIFAQGNQPITGKWYGVATSYYGEKQRLIVELNRQGDQYTGTLQSPDQTSEAIAFDQVVYRKDTLLLSIADIRFAYTGVWDAATQAFKGLFSWSGQQSNFDLSRKEIKKEDLYKRPQEPKPPYPYHTEEVKFVNRHDSVQLAGTFTRPADNISRYPVVVMISGSGPQDRDEEMASHKTFLVLADYLARNGIASLRYDDRGTAASGGTYATADIYAFARDAAAAAEYLKGRKDVDPHSIGLLGHSEGAIIAQIVAANNPHIAFVVSMAGVGLTGREMVDQRMIMDAMLNGEPDSLIRRQLQRYKPYWDALAEDTSIEVAKAKASNVLRNLYHEAPAEVKQQVNEEEFAGNIDLSPEMLSILRYKPLPYLKQIKCPFMAINGSRDVQVNATANLTALERGLTENGNRLVTIRKFEGLNHLFQRCKTCTVTEYGELEQTIDPLVPEFIAHWILQLPPLGQ